MSAKFRNPATFQDRTVVQVYDDLHWYISPHLWTTFADTNCTVTIASNTHAGVAAIAAASAVDNDQVGISTTNAIYKPTTNTAIECVARLAYSEASTNKANVCFGLADDFTTDVLGDNGTGPAASHTAFLIYKLDTGTNWVVHSSVGTTQTTTTTNAAANTGTTYVELKVVVEDQGDGTLRSSFFLDDTQLRDNVQNLPISHSTTGQASAVAMKLGAMVKNGSSNAETLNLDYVWAGANRP